MQRQSVSRTQQQMPTTSPLSRGGVLQRKCGCGRQTVAGGECGQCLQKKNSFQHSAVKPPALHSKLTIPYKKEEVSETPPVVDEVLKFPGEPLDIETRSRMESHFNYDFSEVRIHTGLKAAKSVSMVDAEAYTIGRNIVFNSGKYLPLSVSGQSLLAHELAHVIHQSQSTTQQINPNTHAFEIDADRAAMAVIQKEPVHLTAVGNPSSVQFQRRHPRHEASRVSTTSMATGSATGFLDFLQQNSEIAQQVFALKAAFQEMEFALPFHTDWLRRGELLELINDANEVYRRMDDSSFTASLLIRWLRIIWNVQARVGNLFDLPPGGGESDLGQKLRRVAELRSQVHNSNFIQDELRRRQEEREETETRDQTESREEEQTRGIREPVASETSTTFQRIQPDEVDRIYIRQIMANNISRDSEGNVRIFAPRAIPAMRQFIRSRAVRILIEQHTYITRRRDAMRRSIREADSSETAAMVENVQRAKTVVLNAQELRAQLQTDAADAHRLGLPTHALPEHPWEVLERVSARRSMQGIDGESVPSVDRTRDLVRQRYRQRRERGWRSDAIIRDIAEYVVHIERNRQAQGVIAYSNAVYNGMPFLRHIIENDLPVNAVTLSNTVSTGFWSALEANRLARNAINGGRIDDLAMVPAVEAALARLPDYIRPEMRRLIEAERSHESIMSVLEGIGITAGIVLLALVPVIGPELAFAAGAAVAVHGEAEFYFQELVADASLSPEETALGIARPGTFERWMNRLGPILDIAFAGGGRAVSALTRETRAAATALRTAQVESEIAEAGIRELSAAERIANLGREASDIDDPIREFGHVRSAIRELGSAASTRRLREASQLEDEMTLGLGTARIGREATEEAVESTERIVADSGQPHSATIRDEPELEIPPSSFAEESDVSVSSSRAAEDGPTSPVQSREAASGEQITTRETPESSDLSEAGIASQRLQGPELSARQQATELRARQRGLFDSEDGLVSYAHSPDGEHTLEVYNRGSSGRSRNEVGRCTEIFGESCDLLLGMDDYHNDSELVQRAGRIREETDESIIHQEIDAIARREQELRTTPDSPSRSSSLPADPELVSSFNLTGELRPIRERLGYLQSQFAERPELRQLVLTELRRRRIPLRYREEGFARILRQASRPQLSESNRDWLRIMGYWEEAFDAVIRREFGERLTHSGLFPPRVTVEVARRPTGRGVRIRRGQPRTRAGEPGLGVRFETEHALLEGVETGSFSQLTLEIHATSPHGIQVQVDYWDAARRVPQELKAGRQLSQEDLVDITTERIRGFTERMRRHADWVDDVLEVDRYEWIVESEEVAEYLTILRNRELGSRRDRIQIMVRPSS